MGGGNGLVLLGRVKVISPSDIDPSPSSADNYEDKIVGHGGQSRVYVAMYDNEMRAVKVFPLGFATVRDYVNFRREIRVMQFFNDDNIVRVFGAVLNRSYPCIVMEYCSQGPLNHLMGQLSIGQRLYAIRCVARGLSVLHKHLVAHRDLKPANVFVDRGGNAQIGDFGMAKVMSESSGMTKSANVGTVLFMSPEAARGECAGMEWLKSDMWSFGMLCYNVLTNSTPYEGRDNGLQVHIANMKQLNVPNNIPKEVPADVVDMVKQCLQVNPSARPTAQDAIKILVPIPKSPIGK